MKTITEIYYKMKPFTGNSSQLVLILKTLSDHIFDGERWSTMNCVLTLVHLHYSSHTFQGNHQSLQWNLCAHVNINFQ